MMQNSDKDSTKTNSTDTQQFKQYRYRWVITGLFGMCTMTNALATNNIPPIATRLTQIYSVTPATINSIGMIYLFVYTFMNFPANYFIDKYGLRNGLLVGSCLFTVGCLIELLVNVNFFFLIFGSLLVAIGQPFIINCPAKVATFWFQKENRTFATSVLNAINIIGVGLGFVLPTLFVKQSSTLQQGKSQVFGLLFFEFTFSAVTSLTIFILMREKPPTPASVGSSTEKTPFKQAIQVLRQDKNFKRLFFGFIFFYGTLLTQGTLTNFIFKPYNFENVQIGIMGIALLASGITGSILISWHVKKTLKYSQTFKKCTIGAIILMTITLMMLSTMPYFMLVLICLSAVGFIVTPILPLSYDMGCEISFPVGQALVTGILNGGGMIFSFCLIIVVQVVFGFGSRGQSAGILILFILIMAVGAVYYWFVKQELKRRSAEGIDKHINGVLQFQEYDAGNRKQTIDTKEIQMQELDNSQREAVEGYVDFKDQK